MVTYRVRRCPSCRRRRRLIYDITDTGTNWTCSQGHTWFIKDGSWETVNKIMKDIYRESVAEMINSGPGTILYDIIKGRD